MDAGDGLVYAAILDGQGGATETDWTGVRNWRPDDGPIWVHLQRGNEDADRWLHDESGIDQFTVQALLEEDPRPRTSVVGNGIFAVLRGVNLNPGSDPEDMVSIRVFATSERIVTVRMRRLFSIDTMREDLANRVGARTASGALGRLAEYLAARMEPVIEDIEDRLGLLEGAVANAAMRTCVANYTKYAERRFRFADTWHRNETR
ncbi:MAG: CorA family divalent cation transporter [Alphaproteobacteria bacterium]